MSPMRAAYKHTLQLSPCGDSRINGDTYHVYRWAKEANGSEYDRTIIIEEFQDGSVSVYLDANELGLRDKILQLRRMANK